MSSNSLFPVLQSAYRQYHNTETALLKVKNDILINMNKQHVTLLVLLDLSAAFDTIDHCTLLQDFSLPLPCRAKFYRGFHLICQGDLSRYWSTERSLRVLT